jgi:ATP-dependent DNA helicase HFM1/MER3
VVLRTCKCCAALRPLQVKLHTVVKGYIQPKTDFLFERRLNEYLFGIIQDHSKGRPTLVFCRCARWQARPQAPAARYCCT